MRNNCVIAETGKGLAVSPQMPSMFIPGISADM
jgi:hypothetical protein